ncbi:D-glycerate 2-kinase [archaeon HR04]|nr:D-glycerate 2-kinase [archaeon HR04]
MYIRNRDSLLSRGDVKARATLLDSVEYMLESCNARNLVMNAVTVDNTDKYIIVNGERVDISRYKSIHVIGCGKAALDMAYAIDEILADRIASGIIVIPDYVGCSSSSSNSSSNSKIGRITVLKGTHPIPSKSSIDATERMLDLARDAGRDDLLLFLISGGCSSLLVKPYNITLEEKQEVTRLLLNSGARIDEINAVRKHLSQVKGGRLVEMLKAGIISIIISDVPCNRLDTIASGITAADNTTFRDAMLVMKKYKIWDKVSKSVNKVIEDGVAGIIRETPKPGNAIFNRVRNFIVADNAYACMKVKEHFSAIGIDARILSTKMHGEAREIGSFIASLAYEVANHARPFSKPVAMIAGGEAHVKVTGNGRGGRNQELALSALISARMLGSMDWAMLTIGTDGIDGNSNNAGAIIDRGTLSSAFATGLDMDSYLACNDSAGFFDAVGDSIITGPTGTNLNDVVIVLVI